jgi:hypothetical protein
VTRKSIKDYLFTLFRGLVNWQFIKQKLIIKLSTEIEFLVLLHAATKLI